MTSYNISLVLKISFDGKSHRRNHEGVPGRRKKKFFGRNLQKKVVSATRRQRESEIFEDIFLGGEIWRMEGGMVNLAVLACILRVTAKKGRQLFEGKKVHPRENPGYAYGKSRLD